MFCEYMCWCCGCLSPFHTLMNVNSKWKLGKRLFFLIVSGCWIYLNWTLSTGATRGVEIPSSGQMGQHSSWGTIGLGQSVVSSQMTSSHMTVPLSHTQIWHGSGFHTCRSANTWPSKVQLPPMPLGGDTDANLGGAGSKLITEERSIIALQTQKYEKRNCIQKWVGYYITQNKS